MKNILIPIIFPILLSGCAMSHYEGHPPTALYGESTVPAKQAVPGDGTLGSKRGEASACSVLGLVAWGDAGVEAAARNGGIAQIKTVDRKKTNILGFLYNSTTTIVTGEGGGGAYSQAESSENYPLGLVSSGADARYIYFYSPYDAGRQRMVYAPKQDAGKIALCPVTGRKIRVPFAS